MLTLGLVIMVVKYWAKFTKLNLLSLNIAGKATQTDGNTFNCRAKLIATALSCEGVILDISLHRVAITSSKIWYSYALFIVGGKHWMQSTEQNL